MSSLLSVPNDDHGMLSWLGVVGLKKTWDQKLSSGLLLTIMSTVCGGKLQSDVVETVLAGPMPTVGLNALQMLSKTGIHGHK